MQNNLIQNKNNLGSISLILSVLSLLFLLLMASFMFLSIPDNIPSVASNFLRLLFEYNLIFIAVFVLSLSAIICGIIGLRSAPRWYSVVAIILSIVPVYISGVLLYSNIFKISF